MIPGGHTAAKLMTARTPPPATPRKLTSQRPASPLHAIPEGQTSFAPSPPSMQYNRVPAQQPLEHSVVESYRTVEVAPAQSYNTTIIMPPAEYVGAQNETFRDSRYGYCSRIGWGIFLCLILGSAIGTAIGTASSSDASSSGSYGAGVTVVLFAFWWYYVIHKPAEAIHAAEQQVQYAPVKLSDRYDTNN